MDRRINFLLTTTNLLEGYKIINYLDTVSSHVVTGTGMFSDFAASFSDVFGGRSNSYQKQLTSIKNEVLDNLKNEAKRMGANAIIGLIVDFDEISGKGKTMFMVSAIGTAVFAERNFPDSKEIEIENKLSADSMRAELEKNYYMEKASRNELKLNEKVWESLIENRIKELGEYVLSKLDEQLKANLENSGVVEKLKTYFTEYFLNLECEATKKYMYKAIKMQNDTICDLACEIIYELDLVDLDEISSMLESDELYIKKRGIVLLKYSKQNYTENDIIQYQEIQNKIENCFEEIGERFTKKQLLSSKENEYWKCKCGNKNQIEDEHCKNCLKDIYGFKSKEYKPADGIRFAENKIKVLKKYFEITD